ncbi:hypothetical protein CLV91_0024 [Maribacter vaceletii]|uniref:DUF5343 domain-containing protein n=1 Tax=Maribacter vaceletii TaxID=1206816 RepID=A0A495EQ28_9FLAO|nr:DUF5343 domain-containing protein [Maribacter vaceletii]RKR18741.1 hypothetical protein CLV91_0024 [Maribacter vaceletii]
MSKTLPPYMTSPGTLPKILNKICDASVPETFNYDFLGTKLGFKGGNQKSFVSWAKKVGFLTTDGKPTQIYKNFRNPAFRKAAMANALKHGYSEIFTRNEYAHELSRKDFTKLISEITGSPHDNSTVKNIVSSFFNSKEFADFEVKTITKESKEETKTTKSPTPKNIENSQQIQKKFDLGLNYTINLVLPKTDDPAIFDAIFKSLKENLLNE